MNTIVLLHRTFQNPKRGNKWSEYYEAKSNQYREFSE